jgi:HD-like signal output (HDOD) protein
MNESKENNFEANLKADIEDSDESLPEEASPAMVSPKVRLDELLNLKLQPDEQILETALSLASDKNVRISKLAEAVLKDPVITLEILARANSLSDEHGSIAAVQTGVIRIGSKQLLSMLKDLKKRVRKDIDPDVSVEYSSLRRLSERASIVSEILSAHIQRDIIEISQTCALLSYIGPMILCQYLDREYLELSHLRKRNALAYRLQSKYNINYNAMFLRYLKDRNLPSVIFYAFDKELKCKTSAQSSLRFIVESAIELVEAFEDGKWSRYGPGGNLPPKSNIRLLKISDAQFGSIFEEIEYSLGIAKPKIEAGETDYSRIRSKDEDSSITDDKDMLASKLASFNNENNTADEVPIASLSISLDDDELNAPTVIVDRDELMELISSSGSAVFIEKTSQNLEYEKGSLSTQSQAVIEMVEFICKGAESSRSLLEELMSTITDQGPFNRAALIQINNSKESALIKSAIGEEFSQITPPVELFVEDPLSPLSTCATRVSSFNSYTNNGIKDLIAPFGISSYAISPIKLNSSYTFVLYVDCGEHKPLPLEARKIFRIVVGLLNNSLPQFNSNGERTSPVSQ